MRKLNRKYEASVLAIDPGRGKCGLAMVTAHSSVLYCETVALAAFASALLQLYQEYEPVAIAVGDGTGSKEIMKIVRERCPDALVVPVDEAHSTLEARKLWHDLHPARGLRRLLPTCLRTPDGPCDDLTAVVIGNRYWRSNLEKSEINPVSEGTHCETRPLSPQ